MRRSLVSSRLADSTQQIHSLRASGVMCVHASRAGESAVNAFRRSAGNLCTVPDGIRSPAMSNGTTARSENGRFAVFLHGREDRKDQLYPWLRRRVLISHRHTVEVARAQGTHAHADERKAKDAPMRHCCFRFDRPVTLVR